jgi:hypothetical protein
MNTGTIRKVFDLVLAVPLMVIGGWYVAADAYGLIAAHLLGSRGLIVKEGFGFVVGTPMLLCGLWLAFRSVSKPNAGAVKPPARIQDGPSISN